MEPKLEPKLYEEVQTSFNPLDLIFFRGQDIVSAAICTLQELSTGEGYWSHVGILVNNEILPEVEELLPDRWYVWESTMSGDLPIGTDGVLDIETNKGFFGVQLRDLEYVVRNYSQNCGMVGWSKLRRNPWQNPHNRSIIKKQMKKLYYKYHHTKYNYNPIALASSVIPFLRCLRPGMQDFNVYDDILSIEPKEPKETPEFRNRASTLILDNKGKMALDDITDEISDDLYYSDDDDDPIVYRNPTFSITRSNLRSLIIDNTEKYSKDAKRASFINALENIIARAPEVIDVNGNKIPLLYKKSESEEKPSRETTINRKIREMDEDYDRLSQDSPKFRQVGEINDNINRYKYDGKLFCSEMVAKFFIILGIIDPKYDHRNVIPADLYSGCDAEGMPAICKRPIVIF